MWAYVMGVYHILGLWSLRQNLLLKMKKEVKKQIKHICFCTLFIANATESKYRWYYGKYADWGEVHSFLE